MSSDKHVWHPFSVLPNTIENLNIVDAKGLYVIDKNGNKYADLISSWWVVLHGHSHPFIAAAIKKQVDSLCHIMFADFTHDPAINLAKMLCDILGGGLEHVFFADNGATSVEIAMKMAYQYHPSGRGDQGIGGPSPSERKRPPSPRRLRQMRDSALKTRLCRRPARCSTVGGELFSCLLSNEERIHEAISFSIPSMFARLLPPAPNVGATGGISSYQVRRDCF